ncbi:MAG TPA: alpha/beta hydrolase [Bryobacteraceae bacterium]|jgi:acetyl esterase/lipase
MLHAMSNVMRTAAALGAASMTAACQTPLRPADIVKLPSTPPSAHIPYGSDPNQFADLRLPAGGGPFAVVVVIHGGCWAEYADVTYSASLASALARDGFATWNLEYRRVHQEGGGWPGTFLDVAHGIDALRGAVREHPLDLNRVVAIGHSAGGHLALWDASRGRQPKDGPLYVADPLPLRGVVSIGGIPDLRAFAEYASDPCGGRHIKLMGGSSAEHPDRYALGSPAERLPLGVPQALVWGERDAVASHRTFADYEAKAKAAGDALTVVIVPGAGHHDLMSPELPAYKAIVGEIRRLLAQ